MISEFGIQGVFFLAGIALLIVGLVNSTAVAVVGGGLMFLAVVWYFLGKKSQ